MTTETAPAGRVYQFPPFKTPAGPQLVLGSARFAYREREGKDALWARCHPSQAEIFEALWPGAVVADSRIQRGNLMLGVED